MDTSRVNNIDVDIEYIIRTPPLTLFYNCNFLQYKVFLYFPINNWTIFNAGTADTFNAAVFTDKG
jgi:hypothetical protein